MYEPTFQDPGQDLFIVHRASLTTHTVKIRLLRIARWQAQNTEFQECLS